MKRPRFVWKDELNFDAVILRYMAWYHRYWNLAYDLERCKGNDEAARYARIRAHHLYQLAQNAYKVIKKVRYPCQATAKNDWRNVTNYTPFVKGMPKPPKETK